MHVFLDNGQGGISSDYSNFTRLPASVQNGVASITRRIYFESDAPNEDAQDILALETFPQMYSAHPRHPAFKYYGNGRIEPLSERSRIWQAELEYSTQDANAKDSDGNPVTSSTPPWKLRPQDIAFSFPETEKPFNSGWEYNYTSETWSWKRVANSAGDSFGITKMLPNTQLEFSYATQNWSINNVLNYANSVNSDSIKIVGLTIGKNDGFLFAPDSHYITVYEEGSSTIKWQYWQINVKILIASNGYNHFKNVLDIGDKAKFAALSIADDPLIIAGAQTGPAAVIAASVRPEPIFSFRKTVAFGTSPDVQYYPTGDIVICSLSQYLTIKNIYKNALKYLNKDKAESEKIIYDFQGEQMHKVPLNDGFVYYKAIPGTSQYVADTPYITKTFSPFAGKDWTVFNFPQKGIDW